MHTQAHEINKYMKKCVKLVISKNLQCKVLYDSHAKYPGSVPSAI